MTTGHLFIEGAWRQGAGSAFSSIAPATNETLWTGHMADENDTDDAIASAHAAFNSWRKMGLYDRLEIISRYTDLVKEQKDDLALAIARETGKPLWDAATEAGAMGGKADISLKAYSERTGTMSGEAAGATMQLTHRPHGVMAVIGPFNFPGHLPNGHIIPALIAGNTIVFKPSEMTPFVAEEMVKLWEQAGLPKGVINLVQGGREVAQQLVGDDRVKGVLFTGGVDAGQAIHRALGGNIGKILALELGGNNPLIAWDVEDKEAAARIILRSVYITSGQRCTCAKRLIVQDGPEGDAIIASLDALLSKVRVGAPEADPKPFMGPLISKKAADDVFAAQEKFISQGGKSIRRCEPMDESDAFITPGIIDVTEMKDREDKEVFGPLLQVIRVKDFDAALIEANDTAFGLAAGLVSDKEELFNQFINEINAGIVNWNRQTTGASGAAPFGGIGLSGNHRPAGYYAADYSAWPMASLIMSGKVVDEGEILGVEA